MKRVALLVLMLTGGATQAYGQSAADSVAAMSSALTYRATPEGGAIFVAIGRGPTICRRFEKSGDRWVFVRELVRFAS